MGATFEKISSVSQAWSIALGASATVRDDPRNVVVSDASCRTADILQYLQQPQLMVLLDTTVLTTKVPPGLKSTMILWALVLLVLTCWRPILECMAGTCIQNGLAVTILNPSSVYIGTNGRGIFYGDIS